MKRFTYAGKNKNGQDIKRVNHLTEEIVKYKNELKIYEDRYEKIKSNNIAPKIINAEEKIYPYLFPYLISSISSLVKLILCFFYWL